MMFQIPAPNILFVFRTEEWGDYPNGVKVTGVCDLFRVGITGVNSFFPVGEGEREGGAGQKVWSFMLSLAAAVIPSQPSGLFGLASSRPCLFRGRSGRLVSYS